MHILFFIDQHIDSLGGMQISVRLQKKYLERAGHRVSVCSPSSMMARPDDDSIILPSNPLTLDGEYQYILPSKSLMEKLERSLAHLPPVDIVHIQADFWNAVMGIAYARKHQLPSLMTFHTNIKVLLEKTIGKAALPVFVGLLSSKLNSFIKDKKTKTTSNVWAVQSQMAKLVDARLVPSKHFAETLKQHGIDDVQVMPNGIDDEILHSLTIKPEKEITFIWTGRFSAEKRPIEFLKAVKLARLPARVEMYGTGPLALAIKYYAASLNMPNITIHRRLPHNQILQKVAAAHVFVQTSIGFETQGMAVYEALTVGTPTILSDPVIVQEFPRSVQWIVPNATVYALAEVLRRAYDDVRAGNRGRVKLGDEYDFRQSTLTQKMEILYESLLER